MTKEVLPADVQIVQHFEIQVGTVAENLDILVNALESMQEYVQLSAEMLSTLDRVKQHAYPSFETGQQVEILTAGSGKVWPVGTHIIRGKVFKSGSTENSLLIQLDQPFHGDLVINASIFALRAVPDQA